MSYLTFPSTDSTTSRPLPGPSGFKPSAKAKIKESKMGDRYTQSTPDGLNFQYYEWDLEWSEIFSTEKDTIKSFLLARGNYQTFLWVNPEDSVTYKVKCKEWSYEWKSAGIWSISAKLEQQVI